ncbi:cid14 [Symbiodinium natans]|uniref:Cid14 protein n=1 Tax=Symbiodinium natans TaxID=878477 RepID=A0A812NC20_9DINO|nr:cid14 [Symbiodinium natans]
MRATLTAALACGSVGIVASFSAATVAENFLSGSPWPQARVHVFGSTATKLNLPNADVDVAIVNVEGFRATTAMKKLAELLLEREEVSKIEIIQSAKVPVMKVQHRNTGLMADIVVNRTDGLDTAQFINEQMRLFPALSPLVLFLKLFLSQRNLHETFMGGMGSYVLVCVVLSFLQHHKSAQSAHLHSVTSLGNLLLDFFRYYGQEFRYAATGISVREGGSLFDRAKRGWSATTRSGQATLCLESPTEPSLDIGGRIFKIGLVRAAFNHGYQVLSELFLTKKAPEGSLLCPFLLRQDHPTIAERYQLYREQPAPFLEGVGRPESDEEAQEPTPKKRRGEEAPTVDVPLTEPAEPVPPLPTEELGNALDFLAETEEVTELGGALDFLAAELPDAGDVEMEDEDDEAYDPLSVLPEVFDTDEPAGDKDALAAAAQLLDVDPQILAEEQRLLQEQIQLLEAAEAVQEQIRLLEAAEAELDKEEQEGDGYADPEESDVSV